MNKKLLTAAIGAALAMGATAASADVKLYGKVHVSVDFVDAKGLGATNDASARKTTNVASNASRWGIKFDEKLGGNLKALGQIENEVDVTNDGGAAHTSRNRFVGVSGGFGTVTAGIMDTPFKEIGRAVELFPEYIGDARNLTRQRGAPTTAVGGVAGATSLGWDERPGNAIMYRTPSFNGFQVSYLYSADAVASTTLEDNRRKLGSLGLSYSGGPLYVGLAYEQHQNPQNVGDATSGTAGSSETEKGTRLSASYNFGAFKLAAMWQDLKDIGGKASGDLHGIKRTTWGIGGAYTAGNNVFKAQYYKAGALNKASTTVDTSGDNTGAKMWVVGWDHLFSKTTKMYVAYAKTDNESNASFGVNDSNSGHADGVTPYGGTDPSAWSIGMIMDF